MAGNRSLSIIVASWLLATTGCTDSRAPFITCYPREGGPAPGDAAVSGTDCTGRFSPGVPGGGDFASGGQGAIGTGGSLGDGGAGTGGVAIQPVGGFGGAAAGGFDGTLGMGGDTGTGAFGTFGVGG